MDFVDEIKKGSVFVYPTDTIYGLGCDAGNSESVASIKKIKCREVGKPMSVIAPSVEWIKEHCDVADELIEKYLPGPYTLILKKKDVNFLRDVSAGDSLGVRIPDCEFKMIPGAGHFLHWEKADILYTYSEFLAF